MGRKWHSSKAPPRARTSTFSVPPQPDSNTAITDWKRVESADSDDVRQPHDRGLHEHTDHRNRGYGFELFTLGGLQQRYRIRRRRPRPAVQDHAGIRRWCPALISTGGWPVTVSTQTIKILTAPVVDDTAGRFIGDGEGYLYAVSLTSPGGTYAAQVEVGWATHGAGTGVVDPPIAVTDSANPAIDQVFVFTGYSIVNGIGGAVSQIGANFTSSTTLTTSNTVDLGSASGTGDCTTGNVHSGTLIMHSG